MLQYLGTKFDNKEKKNLETEIQETRENDVNARIRLHGAFKGGFRAGYNNTVGSKSGWAPSEFKSNSKNIKKNVASSAFDFMDQEDIAEFGHNLIASKNDEFKQLGSTAAELGRRDDLFKVASSGGKINVTAIMPRVGLSLMRSFAVPRADDGHQKLLVLLEMSMQQKIKRWNAHGRGYVSNAPTLQPPPPNKFTHDGKEDAFGIGVFEDQEEDLILAPAKLDPKNIAGLGGLHVKIQDKAEKKRNIGHDAAISKDGFVPAAIKYQTVVPPLLHIAPPPKEGWKPLPSFLHPEFLKEQKEQAEVHKPTIRTFLSMQSKHRLDSFLAAAKSTSKPAAIVNPVVNPPEASYKVSREVASYALKGFKPFGNDPAKQQRYVLFLESIINNTLTLIAENVPDAANAAKETLEFSKAAVLYRPHSTLISTRFTAEGEGSAGNDVKPEHVPELPPVLKTERSAGTWEPSKLLCKRFAVAYKEKKKDDSVMREDKLVVNQERMNELRGVLETKRNKLMGGDEREEEKVMMDEEMVPDLEMESIVEEGTAVNITKPSMDLFKAVFADSSSEEEEEEGVKGQEREKVEDEFIIFSTDEKLKADRATLDAIRKTRSEKLDVPLPETMLARNRQVESVIPAPKIKEDDDGEIDTGSFFKALSKKGSSRKRVSGKLSSDEAEADTEEKDQQGEAYFRPVFVSSKAAPKKVKSHIGSRIRRR